MSGKEMMLPSPPPLRTRRASFPRSTLKPFQRPYWGAVSGSADVGELRLSLTCLPALPPRYAPGADGRCDELAASRWPADSFSRRRLHQQYFCCHLLFLLSRFAGFSRGERPEGSLPAFAWSDVAKGSPPIHYVTEWHSLFPSSSTRTAIDLPCGSSSHRQRYALTTFRINHRIG